MKTEPKITPPDTNSTLEGVLACEVADLRSQLTAATARLAEVERERDEANQKLREIAKPAVAGVLAKMAMPHGADIDRLRQFVALPKNSSPTDVVNRAIEIMKLV